MKIERDNEILFDSGQYSLDELIKAEMMCKALMSINPAFKFSGKKRLYDWCLKVQNDPETMRSLIEKMKTKEKSIDDLPF